MNRRRILGLLSAVVLAAGLSAVAAAPAEATNPSQFTISTAGPQRVTCWDVPSASISIGQDIQLFTCNETAAQVWTFEFQGGGLQIRNVHSHLCLYPASANGDKDSRIRQTTCGFPGPWNFRQDLGVTWEFRDTNECITSDNASGLDHVALRLEPCDQVGDYPVQSYVFIQIG